jgi:hypothetical protein
MPDSTIAEALCAIAFPQGTATIATATNDIKGELIEPNHCDTD